MSPSRTPWSGCCQALQVPIQLNGIPVVTTDFVQRAHDNDLACMTDRPALIEEVLAAR